MAIDRFGRQIHYLRISLTDHCNLRCIYCMPEDISFRPVAELMQDDEILRLVNLFARLGFDKFRLTGGEPTVRAGIVDLVRRINQITGVRALSMTTNGVLFARPGRAPQARRLAKGQLQPGYLRPGEVPPAHTPRVPGRCVGGYSSSGGGGPLAD